ncbi:MAG: CPBP family intramembrane metalloprotease [Verrucomicrobiae bacterium]|nr:CPBP family intramembrane metalloprotease [Verrucomicrobiae bacterium]
MRPLAALALYLIGVILGGALLAPWLHALVHALAADSGFFQRLSQQPFSRYLTRCFLALALLGIWPLARAFHIRSWQDLGWSSPRGQGRHLIWGLGLGFASLALALGLGLALGGRLWDAERSAAQIARHLFNALSAAVVVSVLEETLFRGAIFGALRRTCSLRTALLASSALFGLVHFFGRVQWQDAVAWDSGLRALPQLFAGFTNLQQLVPGFINLTLAGAILAWLYHATGTLYASVGLHAGWIFWLKTAGFFTRTAPESSTWLWGSQKLLDGWVTVPVLIAVCYWATRYGARNHNQSSVTIQT